MFTGLIEEIGSVRRVVSGAEWGSIAIACKDILPGTKIGDSIAVNGVCLTVTTLQKDGFTADVMAETLRRSDLGALRQGDPVNLERAMAADGRFGGHIVAGHVDGTGTLVRKKQEGNAMVLTIAADPAILYEIVEKGSITIDGVSLTVVSVDAERFTVSIIPHTGAKTILLDKKTGDPVNLETDVIAKYIRRFTTPQKEEKKSGLTLSFLQENGF
ncbi:MAG: riboflavin synthase [Bacteroidales bacterium]|nr:riboflavin synthase [Anaerotignum sp.]MCI5679102.1 riboflavin synthase [Bacteroidales bacterium]MDY3927623.1 riboflavin synthase [Anaerotignum sp.]